MQSYILPVFCLCKCTQKSSLEVTTCVILQMNSGVGEGGGREGGLVGVGAVEVGST